jgi:SAM-dependent methyltransferase
MDLGCGTSRLAEQLAALGYAAHGMDNSMRAVDLCRARTVLQVIASGSLTYECADATATGFSDGMFDGCIDKATLDSLDCVGMSDACARELFRVMRSGGILISISCRCVRRRGAQ